MSEKKSKSLAQTEMDKMQEQFDAHEQNLKEMSLDRMNAAPKEEVEEQTKLSSKQLEKSQIYLKPTKTIARRDKFNERFRDNYNFDKELVCFIAENREVIGESIEIWTGKYAGVPLEFWEVPVNKAVWGPRYLAEQIKKCSYHRFQMRDNVITGTHQMGQMYGALAVDTTVQRLDAIPATTRKSIFMGASGF